MGKPKKEEILTFTRLRIVCAMSQLETLSNTQIAVLSHLVKDPVVRAVIEVYS